MALSLFLKSHHSSSDAKHVHTFEELGHGRRVDINVEKMIGCRGLSYFDISENGQYIGGEGEDGGGCF